MKRVATKIKGFDDLVEGGFPENSSTLILGSYGTGKTIFGLEYLYNGAKLENENGLMVSFEQKPEELIEQANQCGYSDFESLLGKKIKILWIPADEVDKDTLQRIINEIKNLKAKRVVIDSISALGINAPIYSLAKKIIYKEIDWTGEQLFLSAIRPEDLKKNFIYKFIRLLKNFGTTSLLLSEIKDESSTENVSEYVCDGVIKIKFESLGGEFSRTLLIRKMRNTKNEEDIHPLEISNKGVVVHNLSS